MAHILITEDDRDIQNVTELILVEAGHSVARANNGLRAVELATIMHPDLILMDLALPGLNGWEATRQLKADTATRHIPIVAFTALVDTVNTKEAMAAGCEALIKKPFDLDGLLNVIKSVLAKHSGENGQSAQES